VGLRLSSWFALLAAIALVALAAGCGGGSSSTSSSSTEASAPPSTTTEQHSPSSAPPAQGAAKTGGGGSKPAAPSAASSPAETAKLKKQLSKEEEEPGDHSIQEYGSEANGEQEKAVLSAMRSFIADLATANYNGVCAGLTKSNREQLEKYVKVTGGSAAGCPAVLKKLLVAGAAKEAKKNVNATIGRVRVGEGSAFVLFRPLGGKLSYFVLKEEDGAWKSVSLAPGTPLAP
jgi:hypothetical protein